MASKKQPASFEKSLAELEQVVHKMEQGQLPLEESLQQFELGVQLIRHCQKALSEAQQKVAILTDKQQGSSLEPFADHE